MGIQFEFVINPHNIDAALLNRRDYSVVAQIEGRFEILLNDGVFFHEDYLCLLEFGIQLTEWLGALTIGRRPNMNYDAIDHDDPILQFFYQGDDRWQLYSIWQEFESGEPVPTDELTSVVKHFLVGLDDTLNRAYGVVIEDFLGR